jgi:hypothetical protein
MDNLTRGKVTAILSEHINDAWSKIEAHPDYVAFHGGNGIFLPYLRSKLMAAFKSGIRETDSFNAKQINYLCYKHNWNLETTPIKYLGVNIYLGYIELTKDDINKLICPEVPEPMHVFNRAISGLQMLLSQYGHALNDAHDIGSDIVKLLSEQENGI